MFGRATIWLGIGPHSSHISFDRRRCDLFAYCQYCTHFLLHFGLGLGLMLWLRLYARVSVSVSVSIT